MLPVHVVVGLPRPIDADIDIEGGIKTDVNKDVSLQRPYRPMITAVSPTMVPDPYPANAETS